ncbi:MAG: hypothetical protein A3F70_00510 [Acidobacteria bacterium RIFCSPLOWO2_12_FULL_67_14]|nr:MAG: hypothetical protein A3H29_12970 [Acidobacteria bacterium RIFCSPLOWO2_02_FULL_67_21]OFW38750.1 MAG: hypothetical protein A3F70_00510 [Acidobacteria bacterium RIFCSPLOWO2_12_FULL_67_14]
MRTWPALDVSRPSEPDLLTAALVDYGVAAIDETTQADAWRVFFKTDADRDAASRAIGRQFPEVAVCAVDIPDEDWVTKSQEALRAVRIGNTIVAPPWDVPHTGRLEPVLPAEAGAAGLRRPLVIVIRPSTGFGTGHHATTRMCLLALQQIDLSGRSAVDVGTGSGLLAIAASRLGASRVLAMDDDSSAFHAAQDNLTLNRAADVSLRLVDIRSVTLEPFDVVMANLTAPLIREAASRLADLTAPGGHLILSGFMTTEEADVLGAFGGFTPKARTEEEEWVCVTLQRP